MFLVEGELLAFIQHLFPFRIKGSSICHSFNFFSSKYLEYWDHRSFAPSWGLAMFLKSLKQKALATSFSKHLEACLPSDQTWQKSTKDSWYNSLNCPSFIETTIVLWWYFLYQAFPPCSHPQSKCWNYLRGSFRDLFHILTLDLIACATSNSMTSFKFCSRMFVYMLKLSLHWIYLQKRMAIEVLRILDLVISSHQCDWNNYHVCSSAQDLSVSVDAMCFF